MFRKLVLTTFIAENTRSIVAIETGRVSKNFTILGNMHYAFNYKFSCKDQFRLRSNTGMDPDPRSPNNEFVECGKKS